MLSGNGNVTWAKKHSLRSKWNILFDKSPEWISFKPQLGLKVYPCYSCKNMFSSKLTFQDHINRRVIIIKYKCVDCTNTLTFYNRCSFLLHTRKHFSLAEGQVNLSNVDINILPVELAGFVRHESVPFLYDEEEEFCNRGSYINCQFYTPDDTEAGKQIITLKPFNLVFHYSEGTNNVLLVLKQISTNVPLCEFATQQATPIETVIPNGNHEPEIKQEAIEDDDFTIPIISKIESLHNGGSQAQCPECSQILDTSLVSHLLGNNRPLDDSLICHVCKYVAPTKCSLYAHSRSHENSPPFVCPECGKLFKNTELLHEHMEDICFHTSKNVRFRCPAQKCGKLFVMRNTYVAHFCNHMQSTNICSVCNSTFMNEVDFAIHAKKHESSYAIKKYNCLVCKDVGNLSHEDSTEHIHWHLQDRERCVYIFTCKFCRSYFRSPATFSVHKARCQKSDKAQVGFLSCNCQFCGQKIQFREKENFKTCLNCKQINHVNVNKYIANLQEEKKSVCMLCKAELSPEEAKVHATTCKYNNPIVTLPPMNENSDETSSNSDMPRNEENAKKKRKRPSPSTKSKKTASEEVDLQVGTPISFDGTYYCKLCDYKNTERPAFHSHIVTHRDVSTAYQCMECGQCFVVKPSLAKHLTHFHKITDTDQYFVENDCFNKFAIEKLEESQRMLPGQYRGPLKENQCNVCLEQFSDAVSLSKHYRNHGMAFLLNKAK